MEEPELQWQHRIHTALLNDEHTNSFAELCEQALPHLASYLRNKYPDTAEDDRYDVIVELFYSYKDTPQQYQPEKGGLSLFAYLRMAARQDMVNRLDKLARQEKHSAFSLDEPDVEDRLSDGNISVEEEVEIAFARADIMAKLELDNTELAVFDLMRSGERATAKYAEVMGIAHQDEITQARQVKQIKDKLTKRLKRLNSVDEDEN